MKNFFVGEYRILKNVTFQGHPVYSHQTRFAFAVNDGTSWLLTSPFFTGTRFQFKLEGGKTDCPAREIQPWEEWKRQTSVEKQCRKSGEMYFELSQWQPVSSPIVLAEVSSAVDKPANTLSCREFYLDTRVNLFKHITADERDEIRRIFNELAFNLIRPLFRARSRFENNVNLSTQRKFDLVANYMVELQFVNYLDWYSNISSIQVDTTKARRDVETVKVLRLGFNFIHRVLTVIALIEWYRAKSRYPRLSSPKNGKIVTHECSSKNLWNRGRLVSVAFSTPKCDPAKNSRSGLWSNKRVCNDDLEKYWRNGHDKRSCSAQDT